MFDFLRRGARPAPEAKASAAGAVVAEDTIEVTIDR